ncbi:MAG: reverse transcriptase family protein [Bacteroidetes bacterium]|nr:reverse transcriptase family protein [Bacteroidota bacterium]
MIKRKKHFLFEIGVDEKALKNIVDNIGDYYYEKVELKFEKDGETPKLDRHGTQKKRIIHPSVGELKVIQRKILRRILNHLDVGDFAYGAVKKRDNIKNARQHQGRKFIFTTDLKDFFPSIDHKRVYNMFMAYGFSHTIALWLTQLTTYKGKVPQGARTSATIANLVLASTGKKLVELCANLDIKFTSFVDDLTFSSKTDFKEHVPMLVDAIKAAGFKISHEKTNYKTKNPIVTGVVVKNNSLTLTDVLKAKIANKSGKTKKQIDALDRYVGRIKTA